MDIQIINNHTTEIPPSFLPTGQWLFHVESSFSFASVWTNNWERITASSQKKRWKQTPQQEIMTWTLFPIYLSVYFSPSFAQSGRVIKMTICRISAMSILSSINYLPITTSRSMTGNTNGIGTTQRTVYSPSKEDQNYLPWLFI